MLFAYVITAFLAQPDWPAVLRATFIPHIEWTRSFMSVLVGIFGTTISPYLFFWQAAEEVEEDRERGKNSVTQRRGSSRSHCSRCVTAVDRFARDKGEGAGSRGVSLVADAQD